MHTATWKDVERRTARALGGVRVGPVGGQSPDVLTDWLAVEVKHRAELPRWLVEAVSKIRWLALPSRLGIVVLHGKGQRDSLVVMSLADFRERFGELGAVDTISAPGNESCGNLKPAVADLGRAGARSGGDRHGS